MTRNTKPIILGLYSPRPSQYKIAAEIKGRSGLIFQMIICADLGRNTIEVQTPFHATVFPLYNTHCQHIQLSDIGVEGIMLVVERERNERMFGKEEDDPNSVIPVETFHIDIVGPDHLNGISWKNLEA